MARIEGLIRPLSLEQLGITLSAEPPTSERIRVTARAKYIKDVLPELNRNARWRWLSRRAEWQATPRPI